MSHPSTRSRPKRKRNECWQKGRGSPRYEVSSLVTHWKFTGDGAVGGGGFFQIYTNPYIRVSFLRKYVSDWKFEKRLFRRWQEGSLLKIVEIEDETMEEWHKLWHVESLSLTTTICITPIFVAFDFDRNRSTIISSIISHVVTTHDMEGGRLHDTQNGGSEEDQNLR